MLEMGSNDVLQASTRYGSGPSASHEKFNSSSPGRGPGVDPCGMSVTCMVSCERANHAWPNDRKLFTRPMNWERWMKSTTKKRRLVNPISRQMIDGASNRATKSFKYSPSPLNSSFLRAGETKRVSGGGAGSSKSESESGQPE